ncbi:putative protein [Arabidopsis thaliana]|uniref:Uncharacterized protein AT4g09700 n=2 Tax=Arabidopsis thaliana TaxID=3702 RepID=Q9SZ86_ARATH|nr:hypothetical protein At4g09700 [Arabidopsis thaliana]CAB39637.1 putative protein [Arabidopsis thaliana]CAB78093.1 putative protein [Arabidopsis thaliana]
MAQRYSKQEKAKWLDSSSKPKRRSPLRILESENSALIAENKFTLLGRVTNPQIQRPRALVEYMVQYWNLENRVIGRELGPERFFFRFETEADLQLVLKKAPYHFKKWMFILQRWEPIVSEAFPAFIPFWIKVNDIPMHHCTELTLNTIGQALGPVIDKDLSDGRIRVNINGLEPLEMKIPIRLPTGEVTTVFLEYEKLEKHCFSCFSLSHEEKACPLKPLVSNKESRIPGINQEKTLQNLEDGKRRQDARRSNWPARREEVPKSVEGPRGKEHFNSRRSDHREKSDYPSAYSHRHREPRRDFSPQDCSRRDYSRPASYNFRRDSVRSGFDLHPHDRSHPRRIACDEEIQSSSHNLVSGRRSQHLPSSRDLL